MTSNNLHEELKDLVKSFDNQFSKVNFLQLTDFIDNYHLHHQDVELIRSYYAEIAENKELEDSYSIHYVESVLAWSKVFKSVLIEAAINKNDTFLVSNYLSHLENPQKLDSIHCYQAKKIGSDIIVDILTDFGIDCAEQYSLFSHLINYWNGELG